MYAQNATVSSEERRRHFVGILEDARRTMSRLYVLWTDDEGRECAIFGSVHSVDDHHAAISFWDADEVCETIRITSITNILPLDGGGMGQAA